MAYESGNATLIDPGSGLRKKKILQKFCEMITPAKAYLDRVRSLLVVTVPNGDVTIYLTTDGFPGPDCERTQEVLFSMMNLKSQ